MKLPFVARFLENKTQIDRSFPIAHVGFGISLDRWREFAAAWLQPDRPDRGIFVIQDDAGYMLGLCSFEKREDLLSGPVLAVENFIALDLISGQRVAHLLLESLEAHARAQGLSTIQIGVAATTPADMRPGAMVNALSNAGYGAATVRWSRHVGPRRAAFEMLGTATAH